MDSKDIFEVKSAGLGNGLDCITQERVCGRRDEDIAQVSCLSNRMDSGSTEQDRAI